MPSLPSFDAHVPTRNYSFGYIYLAPDLRIWQPFHPTISRLCPPHIWVLSMLKYQPHRMPKPETQ